MDARVICAVALCCVAAALAGPAIDETPAQNSVHAHEQTSIETTLLKKLNGKCADRDLSACMMLKLVGYFNRLLRKSQIAVGDDVQITQTAEDAPPPPSEGAARSLAEVARMSDEAQLASVLLDKAAAFVRTRALTWRVLDEAEVVVTGRSDADGALTMNLALRPTPTATATAGDARKKKDKNGMGAMMAAAALKIGLLKALAFKALVLLVGKALLVSKLALVLAAVIGLKKLFSQEKHVTYEVVAQPHHDHHDHHDAGHDSYGGGGGGWGRNYEAANNIAYRAHIPKN